MCGTPACWNELTAGLKPPPHDLPAQIFLHYLLALFQVIWLPTPPSPPPESIPALKCHILPHVQDSTLITHLPDHQNSKFLSPTPLKSCEKPTLTGHLSELPEKSATAALPLFREHPGNPNLGWDGAGLSELALTVLWYWNKKLSSFVPLLFWQGIPADFSQAGKTDQDFEMISVGLYH